MNIAKHFSSLARTKSNVSISDWAWEQTALQRRFMKKEQRRVHRRLSSVFIAEGMNDTVEMYHECIAAKVADLALMAEVECWDSDYDDDDYDRPLLGISSYRSERDIQDYEYGDDYGF